MPTQIVLSFRRAHVSKSISNPTIIGPKTAGFQCGEHGTE